MAILEKTALRGTLRSLLIRADSHSSIESAELDFALITFAGIDGDSHSGVTRESCVRVKQQYPLGSKIRNTRQVSIVSVEELAEIADAMQISALKTGMAWSKSVYSGYTRSDDAAAIDAIDIFRRCIVGRGYGKCALQVSS